MGEGGQRPSRVGAEVGERRLEKGDGKDQSLGGMVGPGLWRRQDPMLCVLEGAS